MLENREGQRIPQVSFKTRQRDEWVEVTTDELFSGKTVIVFSLPGAFTPTCSSAHVPRYNELEDIFRSNGVDDIICMSVNDAFVMNEWARDQCADKINFIPDGNGEFTAGMGMLVDKQDLGFGKRSWRYAMLVKDQVIEKMFIEPDVPGDPYEVSDADTMLGFINPSAEKPLDVTLFTKPGCEFCARAKKLLRQEGVGYEEVIMGGGIGMRTIRAISGSETVPQVFVNGNYIGDSKALESWLAVRDNRAA